MSSLESIHGSELEQDDKRRKKEKRSKDSPELGEVKETETSGGSNIELVKVKKKKRKTLSNGGSAETTEEEEGIRTEDASSTGSEASSSKLEVGSAEEAKSRKKEESKRRRREAVEGAHAVDEVRVGRSKKSKGEPMSRGSSAGSIDCDEESKTKESSKDQSGDSLSKRSDSGQSAMAESIRSNLMSPLTRVRQTGARSRSGSSPMRSPAVIRAQVQADTERLAKAGNLAAKRILHRAKSESEVSMNSWDLGSTAGLRSAFTTNEQLLARAHAAATRRSKGQVLKSRESALKLPDSFTPEISKDLIAEQLMSPLRSRAFSSRRPQLDTTSSRDSGELSDGPLSSITHSTTSSAPQSDISTSNSSSMERSSSKPSMRSKVHSSSLDDSSVTATSPSSKSSTPKAERSNSKRSLASFGRKSSYHQLSRTPSGLFNGLTSGGSTAPLGASTQLSASPTSTGTNMDSSSGEKAKTQMEFFLQFVSSHLSNHQLAEGIALMHSILVPSTFLFDHLVGLFRGDVVASEMAGSLETLQKDIINFMGIWVSAAPTDFADDFVLEKKLNDWISTLRESSDRLHLSFSLLLQTIVNQTAAAVDSLEGRTLTDAEILDMAEAIKRGQSPGDVIALSSPSIPALNLSGIDAPDLALASGSKSSSRPKATSLEEAGKRESNKSLGSSSSPPGSAKESPSVPRKSARDASLSPTPSPPPFSEPSFENMVDLARRVSSRELRSEVVVAAAATTTTSTSSSISTTIVSPSPHKALKAQTSASKLSVLDSPNSKKSKSKDESSSSLSSGTSSKTLSGSIGPIPTTQQPSAPSLSATDNLTLAPDADELCRKPRFGKKLLSHLSEQIGLKEAPLLLNISPMELAKQWTLLDHSTLSQIRARDMLLNVSKPSRSVILTDIANKFNHATCWVAVQILKIPNLKKRALAVSHMIVLAETLLNLTNLHGFIAVITGLCQHSVSRLHMTWKKVDPAMRKVFDALVALASPIGNFKQLRSIHDNALPPFVPTPAMFLRDLLFVIDGNGGSFVQNSIIKTDMILLCRKVLSRVQSSQQASYKFWGVDAIQQLIRSGKCLTNEELDSLSEKVESGRDM